MFANAAAIESELIAAGLSTEEARTLAAQARPGVWLETHTPGDESEIALGATKFGGRPDLPAGFQWPVRPAYAGDSQRARMLREQIHAPDRAWRWATPAQREQFRQDSTAHLARLEAAWPLHFLAQIDFAQMWSAGPLDPDMPRSGRLSIFYDMAEQLWGFDPADASGWRLVFDDGDRSALVRRQIPDPIACLRDDLLPVLACRPRACMTPLPLATAQATALVLSEQCTDALHEWWTEDDHLHSTEDGRDWKCHRVGGWPTPVQGDMQTECALVAAGHYCGDGGAYRAPELAQVRATATDWLLLMQIGSDEKGNLAWGDNGQLYVWIRRDDLRQRRFDRARLVLQCY